MAGITTHLSLEKLGTKMNLNIIKDIFSKTIPNIYYMGKN
jgi:hypothetical protein